MMMAVTLISVYAPTCIVVTPMVLEITLFETYYNFCRFSNDFLISVVSNLM
jgi:hypothetical protein